MLLIGWQSEPINSMISTLILPNLFANKFLDLALAHIIDILLRS